jgi:hypothetical protein
MRKFVALAAIIAGTLVVSALPAGAITGDYKEDFEHPFVGLVRLYDQNGQYLGRCSGSLLTPTVFLTAGHCTVGVASARVYFQQSVAADYDPQIGMDPVTGYPKGCGPGTLGVTCATSSQIYDYDFAPAWRDFPNTRDVGLVILDQPISMPEYGKLAAPGTLDRLATRRGLQETTFTHSGYGLSLVNPVHEISLLERLMAESKLTNLTSALTDGYNLQVNFNGSGYGGACYGDSGGPVFYGEYPSNTIVAITGWNNNGNCAGVGYFYRTDRQEVIDWILRTVPEDQADNIEFVG